MPTAQLWHTRPVFITSTFRDMQKERDYLRDKVFPELMEKLRDRRHRLEPIDLRWGVETVSLDEEQSKELLVLKVCLGEIERSRPFLIALIGDRYGWIPPQERLAAAAAEADFKGDVTGKSITALEIEYGILEMPGQRRRSRFYFRQPLPYNKMPPDIAAIYSDRHNPDGEDAHNRLEALKQRIREDPQLKGRVHEYSAEWDPQSQSVTGLEAFGKMVLEQLWDDLDEETQAFLHAPTPSWQEQERWVLEEFVQNRSRRFVGRRGITDEILRHALAPDAPEQPQGLCLTGEPGSGKSALFSHLYRLLQEEDVLLLANASGISLRSAEVDAILQRWIEELAQFLGEASPLPDKPTADELQEQFTRLLGRAGSRNRVVLLLDALNQLEQTPRARQLTWLPRQWPANVRLIATSLPGPEAEALCSRDDVAHKKLPLLEPPEAREIIDAICGRYHRRIHAEVAGVLLDKKNEAGQPAGGNPLWLELAVEELNLLDADDFSRAERKYTGSSDERLHQLLLDTARQLPAEVEGLYDWMLARNEEVNGLSWSRAFSVAVALGRGGWRESDLRVLLPEFSGEPWDDLRFAVLRRSFRAHLVQRGGLGQYDFFHQQMRLAISRRYLGDAGLVRDSHNQIADYLASLIPSDPLRQNERMYHLIAADNQVAAAHYYSGALDQAELDGATRALAGPVLAGWGESPNPGLSWILGLLYVKGLSDEEKGIICQRFNFYLNDVLENNCDLSTRLALLQPVQGVLGDLAASDPSNSSWQRDLSVSFDRVGDVFSAQGDLAAALKAYQNSLAIREKLAASDPSNSSWQRDLSVSFDRVGDVFSAQGDLAAALKAYQNSLAIAEKLAASDPSNSSWQRDLSVSFDRVGDVFSAQGDLAAALKAYQNSLAIREKLAASDPSNSSWQRDLSVSFDRVGDVFSAQGDLAAALKAYQNSLAIREKLAASDPSNSSWQRDLSVSHNKIGDVFSAQGDLAAALKAYQNSLAIREKLAASDPSNSSWQRDLSVSFDRVGDVFSAQGDLAAALKAYQNSLAIREKLAASDPSNSSWQRDLSVSFDRVGDVFSAQGDLAAALKAYQNSLAIREKLAASDPSNSSWQRDLSVSHNKIGDVFSAQGDLAAALKAYQNSLAIREKLAASDPSNSEWQRDLSVSHNKIGDVFSAQGDLAAALKAYQNSLAIREKLAASDPSNSSWQRDLSVSHNKIGDVFRAQGDLAAALKAYQNSLAIREKLAASDPSNSSWQRDLSVSHNKIGDVFRAQGDLAAALKAYQQSLAIREKLAASDPSNSSWQRDLSVSHNKIGDVFSAQGDLAAALKAYQNSLAIAEKLAASDPSNSSWQRDLSVSFDKIGDVFSAQGDLAAALKAYQQSLAIREKLAASDPSNSSWQRDLWVSYWRMALMSEEAKDGLASSWWRKAYDKLYSMKKSGLFISPEDEKYLAILQQKAGIT